MNVSDSPGRGRKKCPSCNLYPGVRIKICPNCNYSFEEKDDSEKVSIKLKLPLKALEEVSVLKEIASEHKSKELVSEKVSKKVIKPKIVFEKSNPSVIEKVLIPQGKCPIFLSDLTPEGIKSWIKIVRDKYSGGELSTEALCYWGRTMYPYYQFRDGIWEKSDLTDTVIKLIEEYDV